MSSEVLAFLYGAALFCGRIDMLIPCIHTFILLIDVLPAFSVYTPRGFCGSGLRHERAAMPRAFISCVRALFICVSALFLRERRFPGGCLHYTAGTVASRNFPKEYQHYQRATSDEPQGNQLFAQANRNFVINVTNVWRISGRGMTDGGLMSGTIFRPRPGLQPQPFGGA